MQDTGKQMQQFKRELRITTKIGQKRREQGGP
jgi:hypothetical protein